MLPWETPELVRANLGVVAALKVGDKLSVLKEGEGTTEPLVGNRGLRERFKVSSSAFARGKKGETITDENLYLNPLVTLFTRACELTGNTVDVNDPNSVSNSREVRRDVSPKEIDAALDGVRQLKLTYDRQYNNLRDPDAVAHRAAAQKLVTSVSDVVARMARRLKLGNPMEELGLTNGTYGMQMPTARAWRDRVPRNYRANKLARLLHFLLEAYEANSVLFQRPEDRTYRKVHLRFDLYLASKIWLARNPELNLGRGRVRSDQQDYAQFHLAVSDLHDVSENLLCKSLRVPPEQLQGKIDNTFGRQVDPELLMYDIDQVQSNTLVFLNDLDRQRFRLVFTGGLVKRYPFNRPDLDPDQNVGGHDLVWADTYNDVGEVTWLDDSGRIQRHNAAGFVLGHDRVFYLTGLMSPEVGKSLGGKGFKHSSYFSGKNVLFAGNIRIKEGRIELIDSGSGHYKPGRFQMLHCLQALVAHGVSLSSIKVTVHPIPKEHNASRYLSTGGRCS
jgi:hypothetical protein